MQETIFQLKVLCQTSGHQISSLRLEVSCSEALQSQLSSHASLSELLILFPSLSHTDLHFLEYWSHLSKEYKSPTPVLHSPFPAELLAFFGEVPTVMGLPHQDPKEVQYQNKAYFPKLSIDLSHFQLSFPSNEGSYLFLSSPSYVWHKKYFSPIVPLLEKNTLLSLYKEQRCIIPIKQNSFFSQELQKKESPLLKYISAPTIIESANITPVFEFNYNKADAKYELSLFLDAEISPNKIERFPLNLESTRKFLKNNSSFIVNGAKNTSLIISEDHEIRPKIANIIETSFQNFYAIMGEIQDNKIITDDRSNFFERFLPQVSHQIEIYRSGKKNKLQFVLGTERANISINRVSDSISLLGNIDWLSINFEYKQQGIVLSLNELEKIIQQGFLETEEQIITIGEEELDPIKKLLEFRRKGSSGEFNIQSSFLPWILKVYPDAQIPDEFLELQNFINHGTLPTIPDTVHSQFPLRDYQKVGVERLSLLQKFGFGTILADEMGLGKTLQVLSLLSIQHKKGDKILIVTPSALIFNWELEVQKFFPNQFRVLVVHGAKTLRDQKLAKINDYDIIITSYHMLGFDLDRYSGHEFSFCIIDEAQHIKNRNSKRAKNIKQIKSRSKIAVSGTPLENNIAELWSIFDFTMPGFLGTYKHFQKEFEEPLQRFDVSIRKQTFEKLQQICSPFIIRRTKDTVYKELPPKIDQTIIVELSDKQKSLYLKTLEVVRTQFQTVINENRFSNQHIDFLSALTKLRQITLHPGLIHPELIIHEPEEISSKLVALLELLEESLDSNHRVLVFSQFVSMLDIIKPHLDERNLRYSYIDGHTKNRVQATEEFNQSDIPIFLISLRAGGIGLNLTGADTVILFDPWWNPAVENQAIDRAHRIGQQKTVHIYRLMTKGTIEEKIFNLQQKKTYIFDNIMQENHNLGSFSSEELLSLISPPTESED